MSQVETQQPVCAKCGVEVRPNTDFCYNCGASVTDEAESPAANGAGIVSNKESSEKYKNGSLPSGNEKGNTDGLSARLEDRRPPSPKYESAAGLRRRSKAPARKPVEVTWEPEGETVNLKFVIAAV
ncbi:MAG TPA: zinc ribbon domain-containing protein, partial [Pyrinomonadaceae bacterium]|nr:zinc ribbon domain-containing protein [Pyrinomonadaceae bacterium]